MRAIPAAKQIHAPGCVELPSDTMNNESFGAGYSDWLHHGRHLQVFPDPGINYFR